MLKDKIKKLISLIENTEIEEIEVSSFWGAQKIRLSKSKQNQSVVVANQVASSSSVPKVANIDKVDATVQSSNISSIEEEKKSPVNNEPEDDYSDTSKFKVITAPLVGTFYASPKPEDPAYVSIGDDINKGQIVCIIEAMKIFNDIESDFSGNLVEIYVKDGNPVEYGQELFVLKIDNV